MMKRIFFLFTALTLSTGLWANSITYTATAALDIKTVAFDASITFHTFANGEGNISFDGDVTTIQNGAFANLSALLSITLPNTIKTIAPDAFYGAGTASAPVTLTLPDNWKYDDAPLINSSAWRGGYFNSNLYLGQGKTEKDNAIAEIADIVKDYPTSAFLQELLAEEKVKINNAVNRQEVNERKLVAIGILESALSIYPKAFAEGDAAGYQRGKAEGLGSLGTEQSGPAVKVTKGTESIILYSPEKVEYMIIQK